MYAARQPIHATKMTMDKSIAQPHTREALPAQRGQESQATHSVNPFHFRKNSTFPLTIRWSSTFSTTNSSGSSCVSWESFLPLVFCFLPMLYTKNEKNLMNLLVFAIIHIYIQLPLLCTLSWRKGKPTRPKTPSRKQTHCDGWRYFEKYPVTYTDMAPRTNQCYRDAKLQTKLTTRWAKE